MTPRTSEASSAGLSSQSTTTSASTVLRPFTVCLRGGEDILESTRPVTEPSDHRRSPPLPPEPQTGVSTNEVVVTSRERELPTQSQFTTRVSRRASTQIGDRLPDRKIEALDVCGVRASRILRLAEFLLQSPGAPITALHSTRMTRSFRHVLTTWA
jgi:hypothetical protein